MTTPSNEAQKDLMLFSAMSWLIGFHNGVTGESVPPFIADAHARLGDAIRQQGDTQNGRDGGGR